jgi:hypothetical protein
MNDSDIQKTIEFFSKAYPNIKSKNIHTQLGVHFEEIGEMLNEMTGSTTVSQYVLDNVKNAIIGFGQYLKENDNIYEVKSENRVAFLDGLCDQIVTASGTAYMLRMDIVGGFGEVNRSNASKFDENGNPILDSNLKMVKGPNYFKPNLEPYV